MWYFWSALILALVIIFVVINLLVVVLTYSMCWYEYANATPKLIDNRFKSRNIRMSLSLILQETCFNILTLLIIPFGLFNPRRHPKKTGRDTGAPAARTIQQPRQLVLVQSRPAPQRFQQYRHHQPFLLA